MKFRVTDIRVRGHVLVDLHLWEAPTHRKAVQAMLDSANQKVAFNRVYDSGSYDFVSSRMQNITMGGTTKYYKVGRSIRWKTRSK